MNLGHHFYKTNPCFHVISVPHCAAQQRPLALVNVTGTDLLPVLAAFALRSFPRFHEALLDPALARLGALRPAGPRLHPAT